MPTTRSSRPEAPAISVIDSVEVLEAKIVCGGQILFSLPNSSCLTARSSNTASMTRSALAEVVERGGARQAAQHRVLVGGAHLAALDRLGEEAFGLARGAIERRHGDVVADGGEARARRDDGDAGAHGAAAPHTPTVLISLIS